MEIEGGKVRVVSTFEEDTETDGGGLFLGSVIENYTKSGPVQANPVQGEVLHVKQQDEVFRDDLTGQLLNPELIKKARKKELDYFNSKGV